MNGKIENNNSKIPNGHLMNSISNMKATRSSFEVLAVFAFIHF